MGSSQIGCCPSLSDLNRGESTQMDETTVKIVAAILAFVLLGIVVMRRKNKPKNNEDEF